MTTFIEVALRGSVVLLVGLVAYAALRRQSPGLRHAVLAATLCAAPLAVPLGALLPAIAVPLPRLGEPAPSTPSTSAPAVTSVVALGAPEAAAAPAEPVRLSHGAIAMSLWAAGTAIGLGILLLSLLRLTRVTRSAAPIRRPQWDAAGQRHATRWQGPRPTVGAGLALPSA